MTPSNASRMPPLSPQKEGKLFESNFQKIAMSRGISITRMPDGCRAMPGGKIARVPTPFDWFMSLNGRTALIDTKSTMDATFRYSKITPHQVLELRSHERQGVTAGYVIYLRGANSVIFMGAGQLCARIGKEGSIAPLDLGVVLLGSGSNFDPSVLLRPGLLPPKTKAPGH